ncbi:MAG: NAD(P)-dependent alcohol dehydrogenase [Bacteroidales bacterium]|jgi:NADPH:quinone reductase-like Zn-dependent oxidoreductase|nr:NAD(P)-dependent alcohol dehydrogenase [Bacteroidales bacterium]
MKAIFINEYGGSDKLQFNDLKDPSPEKGEVLIRVAATSVNPVDWKVREGRLKFLSGKKFPIIMGTELAGEIIGLGEGVTDFEIGNRVFAGLSHKGGACAEMVAVNVKKVSRIPDLLSFEDASTLAIAGVTPLQALTLHYKVKPGDEVLVNGASGGVGTYAVQIAKLLGARVTAVCSERNIDLVKSLGADEVIDYSKEDFRKRNNAFDLILDAAANTFFPEAKACLKRGGMLIKLNLSVNSFLQSIWTNLFASKNLKMILVKNRAEDVQWLINQIITKNIKVIIEKTYSLENAREAQEYSQSGRVRGKLVVKM